jgi:hypothetical protein
MNRFRQTIVCRLLALSILLGVGAWAMAPLAAAHPQAAAAQLARVHAVGPVEHAIAEALAAAARAPDAREAFRAALLAALDERPGGELLAERIADDASGQLLLDLLVGSLLHSKSSPSPLLMAAAAQSAQAGASGGHQSAAEARGGTLAGAPVAGPAASAVGPRVVVDFRTLSSARALGP